MEYRDILCKTVRVIKSCKTLEQLEAAKEYTHLFLNKLPHPNNHVVSRMLFNMIYNKRKELEEIYE